MTTHEARHLRAGKDVPSQFESEENEFDVDAESFTRRLLPHFPSGLETPYTHLSFERLQRSQTGCSLLHFTSDAAQGSQEDRTFRIGSLLLGGGAYSGVASGVSFLGGRRPTNLNPGAA